MGRLFGYARVSTSEQCLEIQIDTLKKAGVESHRIWTDKASGKDMERKGLQLLLLKVEDGDELLVTKLDRLGRNTLEMCKLIEELDKIGVNVKFLDDGMSTHGVMGKLLITIVSAIAQAERERTLERINEGRVDAQKRGVKFGRKRSVDRKKVLSYHKDGCSAIKISREMKIGRCTVYKILKEETVKKLPL